MADIFISYKSERRAAAEHLSDILEDHGYSVWFDYALATGSSFSDQIARELEAARCVVVLWCSMSVGSRWVRREARFAQDAGTLCPVFIETVKLPFPFHDEETIDLRSWDAAPEPFSPKRLIDEVARHLGRAPEPDRKALGRFEKTWRRFGAPTLAEFAVSEGVAQQDSAPNFGPVDGDEPPSEDQRLREEQVGVVDDPTTAPPPADTASARAWAEVRGSLEPTRYDAFLATFPECEEATDCRAERLIAIRTAAFAELPRDGYDPSPLKAFADLYPGTYEAFQAAQLIAECDLRIKADVPSDAVRTRWEQEAAVALVSNGEISERCAPHIRKLSIDASDETLFANLKSAGVPLNEVYEDPGVSSWMRVLRPFELSPIARLRSLESLSMRKLPEPDLSPIAGLTNLKELAFTSSKVMDLSPLSDLRGLQKLAFAGSPVTELTPLTGLQLLEELYCHGTAITDLSPLSRLSRLRHLDCAETMVSDLSALSGLNDLERLYVLKTPVSDLAPLKGLQNLETLYVHDTCITDIASLSALTSLQSLTLDNTRVSNLAPLAGLENLQRVSCDDDQVTDWAPVDHVDYVFGRPENWVRKRGVG
ncbi:MAG: leucine-rich repeat domain-containing protein [Pseudomonadota bacterium]